MMTRFLRSALVVAVVAMSPALPACSSMDKGRPTCAACNGEGCAKCAQPACEACGGKGCAKCAQPACEACGGKGCPKCKSS
jgi:hypothetical protein